MARRLERAIGRPKDWDTHEVHTNFLMYGCHVTNIDNNNNSNIDVSLSMNGHLDYSHTPSTTPNSNTHGCKRAMSRMYKYVFIILFTYY
jgi:hypothetical protein